MLIVGCRLSYGVRTNGQEIFVSEVRARCASIRNFMIMIVAIIFELITLAVAVFTAQDRYMLHQIEIFFIAIQVRRLFENYHAHMRGRTTYYSVTMSRSDDHV